VHVVFRGGVVGRKALKQVQGDDEKRKNSVILNAFQYDVGFS
jgi:hypothetical protein